MASASLNPAPATEQNLQTQNINTEAREHKYPCLYQINTRVWLRDLSQNLARQATLNDIPDGELDQLAQAGFDWLWFLGVWQTGQPTSVA